MLMVFYTHIQPNKALVSYIVLHCPTCRFLSYIVLHVGKGGGVAGVGAYTHMCSYCKNLFKIFSEG